MWREEKGRTIVTLDFKPSGSAFVVFRRPAAAPHATGVKAVVSARPDPALPEKKLQWPQIGEESETFTGNSITMNSNVTISANYEDQYFNVVVNPNGGKFNNSSETYSTRLKYGSTLGLTSIERENYYLLSWTMNTNDSLPAARDRRGHVARRVVNKQTFFRVQPEPVGK